MHRQGGVTQQVSVVGIVKPITQMGEGRGTGKKEELRCIMYRHTFPMMNAIMYI